MKNWRTGSLTEQEFIKYCQDNERSFIDSYFYFGSEARVASIYALSRMYQKERQNVDKDMYLLLMAQEFLQFLEVLGMVYYGFKHRKKYNTMLYHMFTYRPSPRNFHNETRDPMGAYKSLVISIQKNKKQEQKIKKALIGQLKNIHLLSENLVKLWDYYIKLKHGFIVIDRNHNHRNDCPAIIGHKVHARRKASHTLRHIDLPPGSYQKMVGNVKPIKDATQELLAARKLELEGKL